MDSQDSRETLKDTLHAGEDTPYILEQGHRLSQSLLWKLQRKFFDQQGIEAWRQGTVPHYVTSNPFIANAYAKVIFAFIRDVQAVLDPALKLAC